MHSASKMLRILRQARELRGRMPEVGLFLNQAKKGIVLLKDAQRALAEKKHRVSAPGNNSESRFLTISFTKFYKVSQVT
jgi:hypothetical protein